MDAGVDSLKIEGRIKGAHYVYTVVDSWRKQINNFISSGKLLADDSNLHKVFNRGFTNSFLTGSLGKDMFIDNPRDNSVKHAVANSSASSAVQIHDVRQELYADRNAIGETLAEKVEHLSTAKTELTITVSGHACEPLSITATTANGNTVVQSSAALVQADEKPITQVMLEKRFQSFNNARYQLNDMLFDTFDDNLSVPFKELTTLRNELARLLNDGVALIPAVTVPALTKHPKVTASPRLSLLISDVKDLPLCAITDADIYFKLPESFKPGCDKYIDILLANPRLIPWFPAVLIGKDYLEAVRILEQVKPARIVSNNTGVAYKAFELGIDWIAGPFLNTTNSYALQTLQDALNCSGAFVSNEINRVQMRNIRRPENFKLLYSIYHPILMMTSRQCFFQQTVGCKKPAIVAGCMQKCEKATTITNLKGLSFAVDKQKGGYPSIYNHEQFLNLDVVDELTELFDEFFIDLTNIGTGSKKEQDKALLIKHFEALLTGDEEVKASARTQLQALVPVATNNQYRQGL